MPKSRSDESVFVSALKHYGLYEPEERYKIVCPFHGDVNPSMEININKEFWYCYGCDRHGSTLELVKEFAKLEGNGLNDFQAMQLIKKITGQTPFNNITNTNISNTDSVNTISYSEGLKLARDFYYNLPNTCWYRPNGEDEIIEAKRYLRKRGFTAKTLTEAEAKVSYNGYYPIIFPMYDNGVFRGYVMRTMDPEIEQKRKYMYNKGFKRERTLAGDYRIDTVVIVEGYLDKVKANQIGIKNVVATLGWKITSTQLKKLQRKKIKRVICALDNDECGRKGYRYLKRVSDSFGFDVVRIHYPKGTKDMGDVGPEQAESILRQVKKHGGS